MTTDTKMTDMHTFRSTKRGTALMKKQADAEGYSSVGLWQRDTLLKAAEGGDVVREALQPVLDGAQQGYVDLAQQISTNNAKQVERGLDQFASACTALVTQVAANTARQIEQGNARLSASMDGRIDEAVQNALRLALAPLLLGIKNEIAAQRKETHDYLQSLLGVSDVEPPADGTGIGSNTPVPSRVASSTSIVEAALRASSAGGSSGRQ